MNTTCPYCHRPISADDCASFEADTVDGTPAYRICGECSEERSGMICAKCNTIQRHCPSASVWAMTQIINCGVGDVWVRVKPLMELCHHDRVHLRLSQ